MDSSRLARHRRQCRWAAWACLQVPDMILLLKNTDEKLDNDELYLLSRPLRASRCNWLLTWSQA